jgi:hypothetical protein
MPAEQSDTITCKNRELRERVDEYKQRAGYESRNQAVQDLLRTGLRESQSPILSRWREQTIEWAGHLALFAIIFLAGGVVTPIGFGWAAMMSLTLLAMAVGLVGLVEAGRLLRGQSQLGDELQEWIA